jgi:hypothetical protein
MNRKIKFERLYFFLSRDGRVRLARSLSFAIRKTADLRTPTRYLKNKGEGILTVIYVVIF